MIDPFLTDNKAFKVSFKTNTSNSQEKYCKESSFYLYFKSAIIRNCIISFGYILY